MFLGQMFKKFVNPAIWFYGFSSMSTAASVDRTETVSPTLKSARLIASLTPIVFEEPSGSCRVTDSFQTLMAVILAVKFRTPTSVVTACVPPGSRTRSLAVSAPAPGGTLFFPEKSRVRPPRIL